MKTLKNLNQVAKLAAGNQTTLQSLLNGRIYIPQTGWTDVKITPEFRKELSAMAAEIFGGHENTKKAVRISLQRENRQHWGLSRTIVSTYDGDTGLEYIPGQDMTAELRAIRNALK